MRNRTRRRTKPKTPDQCWTVDRMGRLLAGSSILLYIGLWFFLPPNLRWLPGALLILAGVQLVSTALIGWCPLNKALRWIGAKEREEVFLDQIRDEIKADLKIHRPKEPAARNPLNTARPIACRK